MKSEGDGQLISFIIGAVLGTVLGMVLASSSWRKDAVTHGAAYWSVNPTNGAVSFTWK
jgi:hypothetical protein